MSTIALELIRVGFDAKLKVGDIIEFDNRKAVIILIYNSIWQYWKKVPNIKCDAIVQFVDSSDETIEYKEIAEITEQHKHGEEQLRKPNDVVSINNNNDIHRAYYRVSSIENIKYNFVDLEVTYNFELIKEWPKYMVDKAVQANRRSNFKIVKR